MGKFRQLWDDWGALSIIALGVVVLVISVALRMTVWQGWGVVRCG